MPDGYEVRFRYDTEREKAWFYPEKDSKVYERRQLFSRVNATLEAAMSVCLAVGLSVGHVTFLKYSLNLHFKGTLGYLRVLKGTSGYYRLL